MSSEPKGPRLIPIPEINWQVKHCQTCGWCMEATWDDLGLLIFSEIQHDWGKYFGKMCIFFGVSFSKSKIIVGKRMEKDELCIYIYVIHIYICICICVYIYIYIGYTMLHLSTSIGLPHSFLKIHRASCVVCEPFGLRFGSTEVRQGVPRSAEFIGSARSPSMKRRKLQFSDFFDNNLEVFRHHQTIY